MINSFDRPAEYTAMNTYTPIPFQELMAAGLQREKQYAAGETDTEELDNNLSSQYGLSQVQAPGTGEVFDVGDAARVDARKEYYQKNIASLVSEMPDKGSPLYRQKVEGLIKQMRKDLSPQGVFGTATANRQTYAEMLKEVKESEDAANQPWLYYDKRRALKHFADSSKAGVAALNNMSTIGKDPQINKQLTDILGNMKADSFTDLDADLNSGVIDKTQYESLKKEKVYQRALDTILSTPSIYNSLVKQSAWNKDVYGSKETAEESAKALAANMSEVFAYNKSTRDLDLNAAWADKQNKNKPFPFDIDADYTAPGSGVKTYSQLNTKQSEITSSLAGVRQQLAEVNASPLETIYDPNSDTQQPKSVLIGKLAKQEQALVRQENEMTELRKMVESDAGVEKEMASLKNIAIEQGKAEYNNKYGKPKTQAEVEAQTKHANAYYGKNIGSIITAQGSDFGDRVDKVMEKIKDTKSMNAKVIIGSANDQERLNNIGLKSSVLKNKMEWFTTEEGKVGEVDPGIQGAMDAKNSMTIGYTQMPDNSYKYVIEAYSASDANNPHGKPLGRVIVNGSGLDFRNKVIAGEVGDPTKGIGEVNTAIESKKNPYTGVSKVSFKTGTGTDVNFKTTEKYGEDKPYRIIDEYGDEEGFNTLMERNDALLKIKEKAKLK